MEPSCQVEGAVSGTAGRCVLLKSNDLGLSSQRHVVGLYRLPFHSPCDFGCCSTVSDQKEIVITSAISPSSGLHKANLLWLSLETRVGGRGQGQWTVFLTGELRQDPT